MIVARRSSGRTSVRQAIIALFERIPRREELSRALALDVVASLGAVNGFSIAVACADPDAAKEIGADLPAGVDLRVRVAGVEEPFALFLAGQYISKGFERIIFVAADTVGLSPRQLSTAASVLANESPVLGMTESGRPYLVGVNDRSLTRGDEISRIALSAMTAGEGLASLPGRRMERMPRLSELVESAEINDLVEAYRKILPRTQALLTGL